MSLTFFKSRFSLSQQDTIYRKCSCREEINVGHQLSRPFVRIQQGAQSKHAPKNDAQGLEAPFYMFNYRIHGTILLSNFDSFSTDRNWKKSTYFLLPYTIQKIICKLSLILIAQQQNVSLMAITSNHQKRNLITVGRIIIIFIYSVSIYSSLGSED